MDRISCVYSRLLLSINLLFLSVILIISTSLYFHHALSVYAKNFFKKIIHISRSVRMTRDWTRELLNGFSRNMIQGNFTKFCRHIPIPGKNRGKKTRIIPRVPDTPRHDNVDVTGPRSSFEEQKFLSWIDFSFSHRRLSLGYKAVYTDSNLPTFQWRYISCWRRKRAHLKRP